MNHIYIYTTSTYIFGRAILVLRNSDTFNIFMKIWHVWFNQMIQLCNAGKCINKSCLRWCRNNFIFDSNHLNRNLIWILQQTFWMLHSIADNHAEESLLHQKQPKTRVVSQFLSSHIICIWKSFQVNRNDHQEYVETQTLWPIYSRIGREGIDVLAGMNTRRHARTHTDTLTRTLASISMLAASLW